MLCWTGACCNTCNRSDWRLFCTVPRCCRLVPSLVWRSSPQGRTCTQPTWRQAQAENVLTHVAVNNNAHQVYQSFNALAIAPITHTTNTHWEVVTQHDCRDFPALSARTFSNFNMEDHWLVQQAAGTSVRRRISSPGSERNRSNFPAMHMADKGPGPLTEQTSLLSSTSLRSDAATSPSKALFAPVTAQTAVIVTAPTASRKMHGLKDIAMCAFVLLPYLVMKAFRFILGKLGISEHRWKGVPNDVHLTTSDQKYLQSIAEDLLAADDQDISSFMTRFRRKYSDSLAGAAAAAAATLPLADTASDRSGASTPIAAGGDSLNAPDRFREEQIPILNATSNGAATNSSHVALANPVAVSDIIVQHMQDAVDALEVVALRQGLVLVIATRQKLYNQLASVLQALAKKDAVNLQDVVKVFRRLGKNQLYLLARSRPGIWKTDLGNAYVFECLMLQSLRLPECHSHVLMDLTDGTQLVEASGILNLQPGIEFLKLQGEQFADHVTFMERFPRLRPSDVKKEWVAQAMSINARWHALALRRKDGTQTEVCWHLRSGAFAVHGRRPPGTGLSGLITSAQLLGSETDPAARASILRRLHYYSDSEQLDPEVRIRSVCCVAQALPVLVAGLQRAICTRRCWESVARTRTFLHVQHSLLSDLHTAEHAYLEDVKGALDLLSSQVEIRFVHRPLAIVAIDKTTQRITLSLDSAMVSDDVLPLSDCDGGSSRADLLSRPYRLHAVLFSQGINVLQSLGFFVTSDQAVTLQDTLNCEATREINAYAQRAGRADGPALAALNAHYSPTATRQAKDTDAIWLVCQATEEVGGIRAVNCKSGKDRTAIELSVTCPRQAVAVGVLPPDHRHQLQKAMQAGLSYAMTGENNGQPNAYAFSELELVAMPPGWRPVWQLCGKVMS